MENCFVSKRHCLGNTIATSNQCLMLVYCCISFVRSIIKQREALVSRFWHRGQSWAGCFLLVSSRWVITYLIYLISQNVKAFTKHDELQLCQFSSGAVHNHLKVQLFLWVTKVNGNIPCRLHLTGACRLMQYCMNCYFQLSKHALQTLHSLFVCFQTAPVKAPRLFKLNFIFSKTFE